MPISAPTLLALARPRAAVPPLPKRLLTQLGSWSLGVSLCAASTLSQAYVLDIQNQDTTLQEGESLPVTVTATAEGRDQLTSDQSCTVTGRIIGVSHNEQATPQEGSDYSFSSEFSVTFNGISPTNQGVRAAPRRLTPNRASATVNLVALQDNLQEEPEQMELRIDRDSINLNCGSVYGGAYGPTPFLPDESYGPVIILQDREFDTAAQAQFLLPEVESIAVLTVSGAQARNKTLSRQLAMARDAKAGRHRVSLNIDGSPIPVSGGSAGDDLDSPWGGFISGDFELGDRRVNDANSFNFTTNTFVAGVDYKYGDNWVFGGSISRSDATADTDAKPDETQLAQNALSLFASFYGKSAYIDAVLSRGNNDYDLLRSLGGDTAQATTGGDENSFGLGAGYNWSLGSSTLKLYSRLDYISAKVDGFTETAQGSLTPVSISRFTLKSCTANLGTGWNWVINSSFAVFTPEVSVDYEHQFEGDGFNVDGQFVGGGELGKFEISTLQKDADYFNGNIALNAVFPNGLAAYFSYTGQVGRDNWSSDHYALGARKEF